MTENSETYRIVRKMIESGNQPGVIQLWKNMVEHWAQRSTSPDAQSVKAWLPMWQARQIYSAAELAPILPVLAVALRIVERPGTIKGAARLANELMFNGLPWRKINDQFYFAVERLHYWSIQGDADWQREISGE